MTKKVVLAYSGGLDTSVCVRWMIEEWGVEVVTLSADVGQEDTDWEATQARAIGAGATDARVVDCREEFADDYCAPALAANAMYENVYPLVSALSRPVIVKHMVQSMGGDITVTSKLGEGSAFSFTLPREPRVACG